MPKFPVDAPRARVVKALEALGLQIVREWEHISMLRRNADGSTTPLSCRIIAAQSVDVYGQSARKLGSRGKTSHSLTAARQKGVASTILRIAISSDESWRRHVRILAVCMRYVLDHQVTLLVIAHP